MLVHNLRTGREAIVRVTDRGPHTRGRVIDVSKAAASALGMIARGHDAVVLRVLGADVDANAVASAASAALD